MKRRLGALVLAACAIGLASSPAQAAGPPCDLEPASLCFDLESAGVELSTYEAGAHPDVKLTFELAVDPESPPNAGGIQEPFAPLRDLRIETPPGLLGEPNSLGVPQQCPVAGLVNWQTVGCPNGSQVGINRLSLYQFADPIFEPLYMMAPPGGDVVARLGFVAGIYPSFIDLRVRSEDQDDFGLTAEISQAPSRSGFVRAETTLWGVPAAPEHDTQRCTPKEFSLCPSGVSPARPPGSLALSFMTNPTRCAGPLEARVSADSWYEPGRWVTRAAPIEPITECDRIPFKPSLSVEPTSHRAAAPTGLELSFRLPAPEGANVLESSHLRDLRIEFPAGMGINSASADGLATCSPAQVGFGSAEPSACPDAAKLGETEFDIPALPRRMKGAIYLREPEPGHLFRIWVVADDLGAHIKLPGELEVDEASGQISSVVMNLPQAPVREVRLLLKSGLRAPLVNPATCGTYQTQWEFTPWSGTGTVAGETPMQIDEGCETGGFAPRLSAGSLDPSAGRHAPFAFTLTREDGEQNPAALDISPPPGLVATFRGIPRCGGAAAASGACPPQSRIGHVIAATGAGPNPLWVPQAGKRPTAVYLGGPYRGAPLSAIAVVPAQAGPFDLGDVVVRSAIHVDPDTARGTVRSDPLPQFIEGVPILYRATKVVLDRPGFTLNPTNCQPFEVASQVRSAAGALATPSSPYNASGCERLSFKPRLALRLFGGTRRGAHPRLRAVVRMPQGGANISRTSVALPRSEFLDQRAIKTVCTRVQFAAKACPPGSVYGRAVVRTPLFDEPLSGPVYLRSSSNLLPDLVLALRGPEQLPIEFNAVGRVDSVRGGIRTTFEAVPDAPFETLVLTMQGGRKGLLENSTNLCRGVHRANAAFLAQSGKRYRQRPALRADCPKGSKAKAAKRAKPGK